MKKDDTSPLLRNIMASIRKPSRKAQLEEEVAHEETDMAIPEERHEIDIVMDMKAEIEKLQDEECKSKLLALVAEMCELHDVECEVESLDEIEEGEKAVEQEVEELGEADESESEE